MTSDNNRARPTIREVAALSGTSIKTVSRVMNGVATVDPVLVKKVKQAAAKLNYRPNLTAGNLRRVDGRTNTIGLLLKDISNPFSSSLHRAIEDLARTEGFDVIAGSMDEMPEREAELISTFISRRVDGLLIVPSTSDHKYLEKERKSGLNFVFLDRPANNFSADTVVATNRMSAKEATEHLINYGHKRIAYMGDSQEIYTAAERFAGYKAALAKAKIKLDHSIIHHGVNDKADIERFTNEILTGPNRVTAIFSSQNYVTIEAIRALAQRDLSNEIALVGFDDLPFADLVKPGISLVTQDIKKMAEVAAGLLFARINGTKNKSAILEIPTIFTARGSGEIRASK
jgi:LacI family transcriptional regulator